MTKREKELRKIIADLDRPGGGTYRAVARGLLAALRLAASWRRHPGEGAGFHAAWELQDHILAAAFPEDKR